MISKELEKFYKDLADAKGTTLEKMINNDGKVFLDLSQFSEKSRDNIDLINCMNNPIYFIDKLGLKINIGNYLALRYFNHEKNNIILEIPFERDTIYGFLLYKALFEDVAIIINDVLTVGKVRISKLYDKLPDYLKVVDKDTVLSKINTDKNNDNILHFYDNVVPNDPKLGEPTIIACGLKEGKDNMDKLMEISKKEKIRKYVLCKYNMFDLGYTMKDADKLFAIENHYLPSFLNEYVL